MERNWATKSTELLVKAGPDRDRTTQLIRGSDYPSRRRAGFSKATTHTQMCLLKQLLL